MRGILLVGILTILLFGCLTTEKIDTSKENLAKELENVTNIQKQIEVGGDENLSIIKIKSVKVGDKWQFPLSNYEDEFVNVSLYSDSFIKLNKSHIKWLDESESIWLTPLIRKDNQTVLFNAIYSNDISGCNKSKVRILGKTYDIEELKSDSSFQDDDKWKIRIEVNGTSNSYTSAYISFCPTRIVIYLDGYFSDLKKDDQIPLFRNDNTILFKLENLTNEPTMVVIATKPP